ncbi:DUF4832 domain-containing protein [Sandaracinus amylolyticus]|uniref:DUF4832 domain-containing protein n=1 Tax=Sandaracinus amylolyticus TaxID=927083 RepID=A0A0F6VZP3_9BACT|nr:DUF4832 domain-containing protein [Sandaracinus amylolyticus]AKF03730.1 hypothetical protein DB32_000879 [Sandaracinus amylolyticus]
MAIERASRSRASSFVSDLRVACLLALATTTSCTFDAPRIEGRACPCPTGYVCVADVCARQAGEGDAGVSGDAPTRARTYTEITTPILNPERGFFAGADLTTLTNADFLAVERGVTLTYDLVLLEPYRETALPTTFLDALERGLGELRESGASAVLRFSYNEADGGADATLSQILAHIEQLRGVLSRNADVIATIEAGFIGVYGEWRESSHGNEGPPQQRAVVEALLDALEERTALVRRPELKSDMYGNPVAVGMAWSDAYASRVGHHNECFLGSEDDGGTFAGAVDRWRDYMESESPFVPVGGSMCQPSGRANCATALSELALFHYTFLSDDYNTEVLDALEAEGCMDEIQSRLGYRFVLGSAEIPDAIRPGGSFRLRAQLENRGFAAPMNRRDVWLVIEGPGVRHEVELPGTDVRRFVPGQAHALDARIRLPASIAPGTYRVALWVPSRSESVRDRAEYAIRFANEDTWDLGLNVLGEIEVRDNAEGESDPEATALRVLF